MNLWIKYFKDNESSSDVGWSSTQSSTNASPLHQGKKYRDIKLTNVHKTYCMSKVDIQGIQLFKVINLKQRSTQIEQIDFFIFILDFTTLRNYCSLYCTGIRYIFGGDVSRHILIIILSKRQH